ncbi:MAG: 30S ribosomal protein S16 [Candidatus Omnitrophica bacterium]|nr:30S ribosomal protein S16 [Candidatus Omnitrophota bacterium]
MAVRLRLKRTGTTNKPCWRVIVADSKSPRDGRHIEEVGYYNPTVDPAELRLKEDRIKYWLSVGAQPTNQVKSLLRRMKIA